MDSTSRSPTSSSDQLYISILEKTNQQLSLWYNPYGILVGILAILFTVLTIVAVVVIFFQSREYRQRLDTLVQAYREVLDKLVADWNLKLDQINETMSAQEGELQRATGDQKLAIEKELTRLRAEKQSLSADITSSVSAIPQSGLQGLFTRLRVHKCSKCGWGFKISNLSEFPAFLGKVGAQCPKCGNVDII